MMTDESELYVARHKTSGLFAQRIQNWLWGNKEWFEARKPTAAEVLEQLKLAEERSPRWTVDINEADVWTDYDITQYAQYLPEAEFVKVRLSAQPL